MPGADGHISQFSSRHLRGKEIRVRVATCRRALENAGDQGAPAADGHRRSARRHSSRVSARANPRVSAGPVLTPTCPIRSEWPARLLASSTPSAPKCRLSSDKIRSQTRALRDPFVCRKPDDLVMATGGRVAVIRTLCGSYDTFSIKDPLWHRHFRAKRCRKSNVQRRHCRWPGPGRNP